MKRSLSTGAVVLALAVLLAVVGCSSAPPASTSTTAPSSSTGSSSFAAAVSIVNMAFAPIQVSVKVGETVRWTNNDTVTHTVTGSDFDSGELAPGATFSHTFSAPGSFSYHCKIHPNMIGKVTVAG